MTSPTPEQLRHEADQLRATATRLEAMAIALETEQAPAAPDHPDLRPRGLAAQGAGRR